jgi:hypothetical protein
MPAVGRLDDIIARLEKLHKEAQGIFDAHIDRVMRDYPPGTSFGWLKAKEITIPAGSTLNYIAALRMLREKFAKQVSPRW